MLCLVGGSRATGLSALNSAEPPLHAQSTSIADAITHRQKLANVRQIVAECRYMVVLGEEKVTPTKFGVYKQNGQARASAETKADSQRVRHRSFPEYHFQSNQNNANTKGFLDLIGGK